MSANLKSWFAAQIFQEGARVVWTKYCPHLNPHSALTIVRVGFVCEAPDLDDRKRECGGMVCHVDFGGGESADTRDTGTDYSFTHCCTCELELFDASTEAALTGCVVPYPRR